MTRTEVKYFILLCSHARNDVLELCIQMRYRRLKHVLNMKMKFSREGECYGDVEV